MTGKDYLRAVAELVEQYGTSVRKDFEALPEARMWDRPVTGQVSPANLVLHLSGNLRHFFGHLLGGSDYARERDREFQEERHMSKAQVLETWAGACAETKKVLQNAGRCRLAPGCDLGHVSRRGPESSTHPPARHPPHLPRRADPEHVPYSHPSPGLNPRSRTMRFVLCGCLFFASLSPAFGQNSGGTPAVAPDVPEPGSVEKIAEYTTAPEYLPPSVAYVPQSATVPSPLAVLGHLVGAPDVLSSVAQIHDYFRKLDQASPRVRVERIGMSEEGREILVAMISDEANLEHLDRQSEIGARLADPRSLDRAGMESLLPEGRVFYYLLGGLHSPETGPPEMLMELAHRLAVSEKPEIRAIRENVIVLITPVVEPDGRDRVVEWYERHLRERKLPFRELDRFNSPPYWGHYAFHDNNRDGMQLTLALTRAVNETYFRFHPLVIHDLHESLPLLYISTGHGPYSLAVDPVTVNEWTQFAYHEASELQAMGLPGVWTWGFWDGWWPGYLFSVANNHNAVGRFYETFGNSMPGTFERNLRDEKFVGKPVTEVQWYRPWPPEKKLTWSLRDNTNYMEAEFWRRWSTRPRTEELLRTF
jgi:hypothetical protein